MMFKENFVICIKNDRGQVLRESKDREVFLPFNSSYSILLKNNNNRKAMAEISIDGTNVLGSQKVIINANSSTEIERFCIDGNLNSGRKFEFVKLTDERVQDPTSGENGYIRVRFWLEKENQIKITPWVIPSKPYSPPAGPWNPYPDYPRPSWTSRTKYGCSIDTVNRTEQISCSLGDSRGIPISANYCSDIGEQKGATVEGISSAQVFYEAYIGQTEDTYAELVLKLKPSKEAVTVKDTKRQYCSQCGERTKLSDKYCSKCGNKL